MGWAVNEVLSLPPKSCTPTVERSDGSISNGNPTSPEVRMRPPWWMTLTLLWLAPAIGGEPEVKLWPFT